MKKLLSLFSIVIMVIVLIGADIRRKKEAVNPVAEKKACYGYSIIEFGKGINCNGDTVKLVKVDGGQELAKF